MEANPLGSVWGYKTVPVTCPLATGVTAIAVAAMIKTTIPLKGPA
jgi:hypothetical protein